jgi:sulfite reductase (NADPH) flavoprotein alpha-component
MTIPVLPESAPFTPAQRAWLNGFFAGALGLSPAGPAVLPVSAAPAASAPAAPAETFPWHDPALPMDERLKRAEGRPTERLLMAAMAQLDCGTCGYQCDTYAEAIARGTEKDLTKCAPGGKETARKLKELVVLTRNGAPAAPAKPAYDRKNPFPADVLKVARLTRPGSEKDVRFVSFDLRGSGLTYEVGDALGVYPENCPDLVAAILDRLTAKGDEAVLTPAGQRTSAREALIHACTITKHHDALLELLANTAAAPDEAARLKALAEDDCDGVLDGLDLLDLLTLFPSARPPVDELIAALPPLAPRLYSIASSLKAHPGEVHLTVGVVRYDFRDRPRKGVASCFLAERAAGRKARVFVQVAHGFRLPKSGDVPVIMVGPGTGIAPFRAFLQERRATGAKGKNWLFFGDQRRATDYLFEDELQDDFRDGHLRRLDLAFSRDQEEKVYVQHRMKAAGWELWAWLQEGAHFYVCGDAKRMAKDVDRALHEIVAEHGGKSPEQAQEYVKGLVKAGRYQRDVY